MTNYPALLSTLSKAGIEFIVVGGLAAVVHGAARPTFDLDIVYRRTVENENKLADALSGLNPTLRGAPPGLPFRFDAPTIRRGLNFTLTTTLGDLDLLGEITGGGSYDNLVNNAPLISAFGVSCRVLDLETLITVKRAAGRPKDFEAIAELERLRDKV